jgi:hypothetical protein
MLVARAKSATTGFGCRNSSAKIHGSSPAPTLLGVSERTFRRWRDRHREMGLEGLSDRRLAPSLRRAPVVEVRETAEEPVVAKTAHVAEEVVVGREATERTETVKDTVRREEVEVTGDGVKR